MPYANNDGVKIYWEEQGEGDLGAQASLPASFRRGDYRNARQAGMPALPGC